MFCGKCGKENADDVAFCLHCGADLARQTPPEGDVDEEGYGPTLVICGRCRKGNVYEAAFCFHCGAELHRQTPPKDRPTDAVVEMPTQAARVIYDGKVLAGQYRVVGERPIGSGGMGEVWKATDTELGTTVAIKVLPSVMAHDEHAVDGLRREATIGRALAHANICRLYGLHSDGDLRFIVMEYVEGRTLAQLLAERPERKMTWDELEPITRQIADALDYAHNVTYAGTSGRKVTGVLHRDIKPGNIMITSDGAATLMDFGIAREIHNTMTMLTGRSSQTPLYASPEQFRGEPMTPASDIYSFAAVLCEALAGRPYISPHGDLRYQVLDRPFEPLADQTQTVNAALAAGLSKKPGDRPGKAIELAGLFRAHPAPKPVQEMPVEKRVPRKPTPKRRHTGIWVGVAVVVAIILVAIVALSVRDGKKEERLTGEDEHPAAGVETPHPVADNEEHPSARMRYSIAVIADQNAAIKAEVDGSVVDNFVLAKGKSMEWKGHKSVRLELRDASRVRIYKDGKPILENLGSGPATITYSKDGLEVRTGRETSPRQVDRRGSRIVLPDGFELPSGWTKESKTVTVAANGITSRKTITYYISPSPLSMKFVYVPDGTFTMGRPSSEKGGPGERPQHTVRISNSFLMSATEVTNAQYRRYFASHNSKSYEGHSLNGDDQPVVYVSWNDAVAFCRKLTADLGGGLKCRLPTEAEWEYACRAGSTTTYSWGETFRGTWLNSADKNTSIVWRDKSVDDGYAVTAPVGKYPASTWGLYDMHGNVWEWCEDVYDSGYYKECKQKGTVEDPVKQGSGARVLRGGSWSSDLVYCRSADSSKYPPEGTSYRNGFRVAVSLR